MEDGKSGSVEPSKANHNNEIQLISNTLTTSHSSCIVAGTSQATGLPHEPPLHRLDGLNISRGYSDQSNSSRVACKEFQLDK